MSNYKIKYYKISEFAQLAKNWRHLEKGEDMTYFQTYDWYEMLVSLNYKKILFAEIIFAEVTENNAPILIAPLFITKNNFYKNYPKGAYFFGNQGWNDYCNFIYKVFVGDALQELFMDLKRIYNLKIVHLDDIKECSQCYGYIKSNFNIIEDIPRKCVNLHVPESKEEYQSSLSKNARQNLRTSYNRAVKDGISFTCNFDDRELNMEEFLYHREIRVMHKNGLRHKYSPLRKFLGKIKRNIFNCRYFTFTNYDPYITDKNIRYLTIKNSANGELCGAFVYGYEEHRSEIVIMAVCLNSKYYKYSVGMIALYEYICEQISSRNVTNVDFTRGDEKYKYTIGGSTHYNHSIKMSI